jgi:predicted dithiol-disulfide oxidoreductase (DUF899 family)
MTDHKIASREDWQAARDELLAREKEPLATGTSSLASDVSFPGCSSRRNTA